MEEMEENEKNSRPKSSYNEKLRKKFEKAMAKKERKRLLDLKREIVRKPKKPKILNLEEIEVDTTNLDEGLKESEDLRDIEFKLMNNLNELQVI